MSEAAEPLRAVPRVLVKGTFSQKLRIYMLAYWAFVLLSTVVGIVLLPIWLVIGPAWIRRYHATLRCDLTEREIVVGRGLIFRRELTIPLDKIQDISIREGPLLSTFGLLRLRLETAGQSNPHATRSDADLIGLTNARDVRDRILEQRDALEASKRAMLADDPQRQLLTDIRDSLLRIEDSLGAPKDSAPAT